MSLPSLRDLVAASGIPASQMGEEQLEALLVTAMRRDLPLAVDLLHRKSHESGPFAGRWIEDPGSAIGKQLIRLHASDALRPLAAKHFCHGKTLTFINCCSGAVGGSKPTKLEVLLMQVEYQDGTKASADC